MANQIALSGILQWLKRNQGRYVVHRVRHGGANAMVIAVLERRREIGLKPVVSQVLDGTVVRSRHALG